MLHLGFDIGGTKCAVVLGKTAERAVKLVREPNDGLNSNSIPESHAIPEPDCISKTESRLGADGRPEKLGVSGLAGEAEAGRPEIIGSLSFPTASASSPAEAVNKMCGLGDELLKQAGFSYKDLASIGISCGGPLDSKKGLILSPPNLPGWDGVPVVEIARDYFQVPVMLQNDANAGALAEWKFGAGKGLQNMVFITFGTGCGAGLILNGKLYAGTNDNAGECGHMRLTDYGPVGYGKAGSLEGFCSGGGIAQLGEIYLTEMVQKGVSSELCERYKSGEKITAKLLAEYARKGDPAAKQTYLISAKKLGAGLSILIDLLNPEAIVIGGVYSRCTDLIYDECMEVIRKEVLPLSGAVCRLIPAGLGEQIGDYAALAVASYSLERN